MQSSGRSKHLTAIFRTGDEKEQEESNRLLEGSCELIKVFALNRKAEQVIARICATIMKVRTLIKKVKKG